MKKIILSLIFLTSISHAWIFSGNGNNNQGLTGYSVPIGSDVFKNIGIDPYNPNQVKKSPMVKTDLFSSPQANYDYDIRNKLRLRSVEGMDAKCGVSIIYD